jgi:hypothetical protein
MEQDGVLCLVAQFLLGRDPIRIRPSLREFSRLRATCQSPGVKKLLSDFVNLVSPGALVGAALKAYISSAMAQEAQVLLPEPMSEASWSGCLLSLPGAPFRLAPMESKQDAAPMSPKKTSLEELLQKRAEQDYMWEPSRSSWSCLGAQRRSPASREAPP